MRWNHSQNNKQYHVRRLKPLKSILNPIQYSFLIWITNQKWHIDFVKERFFRNKRTNKLWKKN